MKRFIVLIIFILISFSQANAFDRKGFSPTAPFSVFSTFSTESPRQNQIAIDLGLELTNNPDIKRTNLNISYGLTDKVEIIANLPYNFSYRNSFNEQGAEDINLGFKHRIVKETLYLPAFAYLLFVSGDLGKEQFSTGGGFGGGFIVSKKVGPVMAHGNIIYFNPSKSNLKELWNINLGSELKVSYNSKILLELIGRKSLEKNKIDLLEWRLGYRVKVTDFSFTTVGIGFDVKKRTPDMRFMFGISVVLPKEKKKLKRIVEDVD